MMREFTEAELFAAREMARADLYFYSRWMMLRRKGITWQRARHHPIICSALTDVFNGKSPRTILNLPPRYSKTELGVNNFISWSLGHYPDSEFIHPSYSADLATNNSSTTRDIVTHPEYRQIFPEVRLRGDSAAKSDWRTTAGGVIYAAGAAGTITGFGAGKLRNGFGGAIIIDDPHKADEARSEIRRKAVIEWFQNTIESRKNTSDTPIILIMQRLHEEDLAGWLLKGGNGEKWRHVCLTAIQDDGTALWPEKHSIEDLMRMREAAPYMFSGQYQQDPAPPEGNIFRPDKIGVVDAAPAGTRFVRGWDLASSDGKGDWTAGPKLGITPTGRFVIADMVRLQGSPDAVEEAIVNAAQRDGQGTTIRFPQDPGQAGKAQALYYAKKLAGFTMWARPVTGDKITRAEPCASQVNIGNFDMVRAPWNDALLAEMRLFPNAAHDDQIDALSDAFNELTGSTPPSIICPVVTTTPRSLM